MAEPEKRVEAEKLYVKAKLTVKELARVIGVSEGTVYRWKEDARGAGIDYDWDEKRRKAASFSIVDIQRQYVEALRPILVRIENEPQLLMDPKIADAIAKHVATINRLVPKKTWFSASISVLDAIKNYLAENDAELWRALVPHIPAIQEQLERQVIDL
jgi:transposase-like protein